MCFKKDKQTQLPQDLDYIKTCFSENLSHARHVENERLSFTSIYIALVVGAVAVVFGLDNNWIAFSVAAVLTVLGAMAMFAGSWCAMKENHLKRMIAFSSVAQIGYIFLGIGMIDKVVDELLVGYEETTPIAVVKKATWPDQQIIRGRLNNIAQKVKDANITKTAMIVVGDVLDPGDFNASKLYDKNFKHEYR